MAPRLAFLLIVLLFATALLPSHASPSDDITGWGLGSLSADEDQLGSLELEMTRRVVLQTKKRTRYISYGALLKNKVPCNKRGRSYYGCNSIRANPYRRPCNKINKCARANY